jgi:hypothetical protein
VVAAMAIPRGLAFTAILTGLTFVRFSQPRIKLIFVANPVVGDEYTRLDRRTSHRSASTRALL